MTEVKNLARVAWMVEQVRVFTAKPDNLNWIPGTHMVKLGD